MASKASKTRSAAPSLQRPDPSRSSPPAGDDPTTATMSSALAEGTFRQELLASLREDIGKIIKLEFREVLEKEMAGLRGDIHSVKTELQSYQSSVAKELVSLKATTSEVEKSLSVCTDDIVTLQREVKQLQAQSESLQNKCEDLEARARRNNIRIVGVPESQSASVSAVSVLLQKAFDLDKAPDLDRSHRALQPAPGRGDKPRVIVARLHYFQDCVNILRLARERQQIKVDGITVSVYPDYTTRVARARAGYNTVRQQLRGLEGVRYGILYPARLRITHDNQERVFSTPEEAQAYISRNISTRSSTQ